MRGLSLIGIIVLIVGAAALIIRDTAGTSDGLANDDLAALVSGVALLIVIGGGMLADFRRPGGLGEGLKAIVLWAAIGLILVLGYSLRDELGAIGHRLTGALMPWQSQINADGDLIFRRGDNGHFHIRAEADGRPIRLMVDTGASTTTLTESDAETVGIDLSSLDYIVPVSTANGRTMMARARLGELDLGSAALADVGILVAPRGALDVSLLGNNVLERFSAMQINGDRLILTP